MSDLLHDRYRLERSLGAGGAGQTWLATDTHTGASVTVKELRTPYNLLTKDLLDRETRLLGQLRHPQIPAFVEAFVETVRLVPRLHLVLEFVEGTPLDVVMRERRFTQDEARALVDDLLGVVAWLHALAPPVIHRDIKPSNLILRPDGRVALIDFGLATDAVDRTFQHTMAVGTLGYQAPEQIAGDPRPASDVYGVGVLALALFTRVEPVRLLEGQTLRWRPATSHLDPSLKAWLSRALDPEPAARFRDGGEAKAALVFGPGLPRSADVARTRTDPAVRPRTPVSALVGSVLGLVTVASAGAWLLASRAPAPPPAPPQVQAPVQVPSPKRPQGAPPASAGACRAGDGDACVQGAAALQGPLGGRASDLALAQELLALGCMQGHGVSCVRRAEAEPDAARALRWWTEACALSALGGCEALAAAQAEVGEDIE